MAEEPQSQIDVALIDGSGVLTCVATLEVDKQRLQPEIMFPPQQ